MHLSFSYDFKIEFDKPIFEHNFSLRIIPRENSHQKLTKLSYEIKDSNNLVECVDGFGNRVVFGGIKELHNDFIFNIKGEVSILAPYGKEEVFHSLLNLYTLPTPLTTYTPLFETYLGEFSYKSSNILEYILEANSFIYNSIVYQKGVTNYASKLDAILESRAGVCQDFSHLLLAILRKNGIPARYVNGYILGDGETHAWVEACVDGFWIGVDPTHNILIEQNPYIKVSHGRDFEDCRINRGVFRGDGIQRMDILVKVGEI